MGYRYQETDEKAGESEYRLMEVVLMKKGATERNGAVTRVVSVDNHWETLRYVQDHMDEFVGNIVRVKKMDDRAKLRIEESASLFEKNLEPFFTVISSTAGEKLMERFSASLKKALLLIALDRYQSNKESVCTALGITRDKLESEMRSCGLTPRGRKAA